MPSRFFVAGAGLGGVVVGVVALRTARTHPSYSFAGSTWTGSAVLVLAGVALSAAAAVWLIAVPRRGTVPAAFLVSAGLGWFGAEWANPRVESEVMFALGNGVTYTTAPLAAAFVISSSQPRPYQVGARVAAGVAVIAAIAAGVLPNLWFDPRTHGCSDCVANLLLVNDDPELARLFGQFSIGVGAVAVAGFALVLIAAGWRADPLRHFVDRASDAAAIVVLTTAAWMMARAAQEGFVPSDARQRHLWFIEGAALIAVGAVAAGAAVRRMRARSALTRLLIGLGAGTRSVASTLQDVLGDSSLVVAYPLVGGGRIDADGASVASADGPRRVQTAISVDDQTLALIGHRRRLDLGAFAIDEFAAAVRLALEYERSYAQVLALECDLRRSRKQVVEAGDDERRRLERDLHDGAQQRLIGLMIGTRLVEKEIDGRDAPRSQLAIMATLNELQNAIDSLRTLARGLYPSALDEQGLAGAIDGLFEDGRTTDVDIALGIDLGDRFAQAIERTAYHVVAAMAAADARHVAARRDGACLSIEVTAAEVPVCLGELQDRVLALDGTLIFSDGPSGMKSMHVEIPCAW